MIKTEKISYTYPVLEDDTNFDGDAKVDENATQKAPKALDGVSISIEKGQFVCILGRNGSGKSTLARHLNALIKPDLGSVWVNNIDTRDDEQVWEIRSSVGMVFQNPDNQIIASVVDEDVAFGPENMGVPPEEIKKKVKSALESVRMEAFAKSSPNRLSGGQKQRVAVAGILAMHPDCIVLDESTAMLDPRGREEVMETVKNLNQEKGITVISITHYMDEALDADKIYVMHKGKVIMEGTPKEVFSHPAELEGMGLKLPQVCAVAYELRLKGLDIPKDIITEKELVDAIMKIKRESGI